MHDAAQRRRRRGEGGEGGGELVAVGHVGRQGRTPRAPLASSSAIGRRRISGRVAGGRQERQVAGALVDEVPGHGQAEGADAAGDQVGAVGPHQRWRRPAVRSGQPVSDQLADVAGLRHRAEGVGGLAIGVTAVGSGASRAVRAPSAITSWKSPAT